MQRRWKERKEGREGKGNGREAGRGGRDDAIVLKDDAATAAATLGVLVLGLELASGRSPWCSWSASGLFLWKSGGCTVVSSRGLTHTRNKGAYLVVLADLPHKVAERLVDVETLLRGRLDEPTAKVLRKSAALCKHRERSELPSLLLTHSAANAPCPPTCRSYSRSHLFATTMTGK